jgi:hypothetical protein
LIEFDGWHVRIEVRGPALNRFETVLLLNGMTSICHQFCFVVTVEAGKLREGMLTLWFVPLLRPILKQFENVQCVENKVLILARERVTQVALDAFDIRQPLHRPALDCLVCGPAPVVVLIDIEDAERCCGSAGIYNLTHPEISRELQQDKVRKILDAAPDVIVSANPGCMLQIAAALERTGQKTPVVHTIQLIDASLRGATLTLQK